MIKITNAAEAVQPFLLLRVGVTHQFLRSPLHLLQRRPKGTFLAVQPLKAQGAVTLVALLPGPAAAPVGARCPHARVGSILHIHARCEVMSHVDGAVIQDDLGKEKCKEVEELQKHL